ncbi:MAG: phosphate acyltransferase, partial [Alphaproteobacteria bacterium]
YRDAMRLVNTDRNIYGACMVAVGDGDVFVTGLTRGFSDTYKDLRLVMGAAEQRIPYGYNLFVSRGRTIFIGDTTIHPRPDGKTLASIACQLAERARAMGHEPRVALISYSTFGNAASKITKDGLEAIAELDKMDVNFEYDGEMQVDIALNYKLMKEGYPFSRLTGPANVLLMPGLHAANISAKLLRIFGDGIMIGPIMDGLEKPAQVLPMGCSVNDLVNAAAIGAVRAE